MSASLVGSEMCIRDRRCSTLVASVGPSHTCSLHCIRQGLHTHHLQVAGQPAQSGASSKGWALMNLKRV
eukprot:373411-Alexandrium_andersonii.AAC.1